MVHHTFIHGEHLQRVALKPIFPNHPNIIHTYYRPGNNRLPHTQFGYPGPKSFFRAPSSVLPNTHVQCYLQGFQESPCKPAWLRETPYTTLLSSLQILHRTDVWAHRGRVDFTHKWDSNYAAVSTVTVGSQPHQI